MPYCRKCGTENAEGSKYCKSCGEDIISASNSPESQVKSGGVPTFEPPKNTPTFTPPSSPSLIGPTCDWHTDEPAAANCSRCGRPICRDCVEAYTVIDGEYKGHALCYNCIQGLIKEQSSELEENYATIKNHTILVVVGAIIGLFVGIFWGATSRDAGATFIYAIACAAIGGSFANFCRNFFSQVPGMFTSTGDIAISICIGLGKLVVFLIIDAVKALMETVQKLFSYGRYLSRTKNILEENQQALNQIEAFMQYTLVRSQNKGVDLETLMSESSELFNNSYAQQVRANGEQAADAALRNSATMIAANGEIVRDFAA